LTGLDTSLDAKKSLHVCRDARNLDVSLDARNLRQAFTNSGAVCCSTISESRIGFKSDRRQPPSSDWLSGLRDNPRACQYCSTRACQHRSTCAPAHVSTTTPALVQPCCPTTSEPRTDPLNPTGDEPTNSSTASCCLTITKPTDSP